MAQIFPPEFWNQCPPPQFSDISMGLTEELGSGFCICCPQCTKLAWWHLGEEGGPRDCFACLGTGSRVELSEWKLEGTLCPPALSSSRTSQESPAFVFSLFLAWTFTCRGQQLRGCWSRQEKDTATPLIPSPFCGESRTAGSPVIKFGVIAALHCWGLRHSLLFSRFKPYNNCKR